MRYLLLKKFSFHYLLTIPAQLMLSEQDFTACELTNQTDEICGLDVRSAFYQSYIPQAFLQE